jgi:hypothetical protein
MLKRIIWIFFEKQNRDYLGILKDISLVEMELWNLFIYLFNKHVLKLLGIMIY